MVDALLFALPEAPLAEHPETHWWRIADGRVIERGSDAGWTAAMVDADGRPIRRVVLAPASAVRLAFGDAGKAASPKQAAAIARVGAIEASLGDASTLHAVSTIDPANERSVVTALVDNGVMVEWIDWAQALGVDPDMIVPAATVIPRTDRWVEAVIGGETLIGREGLVMPFDPALAEALVGGDEVERIASEDVDLLLAAAAEAPLIDLRTGRFAKRRRLVVDRARLRELALLAAIIPIVLLLWAIVSIVRLERETDRLDRETLAIASRIVGREPTIESAAADMAQSQGPGASGGLSPGMAALFQQLQAERGISSTAFAYRGDGTISVTLAAPTVDEINRVLIALQRDGYVVTAVPRQAADGRSTVDITIRSQA
ncbi:type II secretion system protein GspL [Sphingomonas sp. LY160]|uniref:type II secretion system protein GspL n=1 Tax=Sphingomonas sp. LY160 TaxID=3095342 RepID=UPI002ADEE93A|nr:type II secretion system protein GspL [Sphingomonas sp. LY160]MEA1072878.1 type II secretion system protein GspL [Sphingomonas sp. LY160]